MIGLGVHRSPLCGTGVAEKASKAGGAQHSPASRCSQRPQIRVLSLESASLEGALSN